MNLYKNLACALLMTAPALCAMDAEHGIQQINPNELRFNAADKWSNGTAFAAAGIPGALAGGFIGHSIEKNTQSTIIGALVGLAICGGIQVWRNERYNAVYDAANGKNMHGAAAANNARGVKGWIEYNGSSATLEQDCTGATPLMCAAANGAYEAAQVIGNQMPVEYEVVDSVTESESVKGESLRDKMRNNRDLGDWIANAISPETVKTKSVKKKRVKTADIQSRNGRTAAHWALYGLHYNLARWLLSSGLANASLQDNEGNTIKTIKDSITGELACNILNPMRAQNVYRPL